jgi:hypothetical protein
MGAKNHFNGILAVGGFLWIFCFWREIMGLKNVRHGLHMTQDRPNISPTLAQ